jgi:hypothetical protein
MKLRLMLNERHNASGTNEKVVLKQREEKYTVLKDSD